MGVTTVRLQPEVESSLEAMAGKLHRSKNWLINEAIRQFVAQQELEQTRWKETLDAIESVAQGKAVSGESVHAWLRSWGQSDELPPPGAGQ
ncbi:CopG family ribbon-helix-helix protein [Tahibacter caeni]|uniref:CopG family ribbon-helix-helix protein n=1 Tax=Tahibacter caeni TaxID=1453545 RepID=UPI002147E7EC|nr:ribbon-helix-helix protein, CopG family [Tahibacter caeni]